MADYAWEDEGRLATLVQMEGGICAGTGGLGRGTGGEDGDVGLWVIRWGVGKFMLVVVRVSSP